MNAAGESGDDKVWKRVFFHSSAPSSSVRKRESLFNGKKSDRLVDGAEEKRAMRGSASAINRSDDRRRISVSHLVPHVSNALLILRGTKWRRASGNWGYYGCWRPWRSSSMARQQWERSEKPQLASGIPRIWMRRLRVMEVHITTVTSLVRIWSCKSNKRDQTKQDHLINEIYEYL